MWLIRFAEFTLKSERTRKRFEDALFSNLRTALDGLDVVIKRDWGRMYVYGKDEKRAEKILKRVFGISSFSYCLKTENDMNSMLKTISGLLVGCKTFALRVRRAIKTGPTSLEIEKELGKMVKEKMDIAVDLESPERVVWVEIRDDGVYIYTDKIKGVGGFPIGVQGMVGILIRNKHDMLAGWLMMRKGCRPFPMYIKMKSFGQKFFSKWAFYEPECAIFKKIDDAMEFAKRYNIAVAVGDRKLRRYPIHVFRPLFAIDINRFYRLAGLI
ncbi:MAG: THUMP domain-containing protein [Candidatus Aenigmatarchaeota archaeon]